MTFEIELHKLVEKWVDMGVDPEDLIADLERRIELLRGDEDED